MKRGIFIILLSFLLMFSSCSLQNKIETYTYKNNSSYDLYIKFSENDIVDFPKDSVIIRDSDNGPSFDIIHDKNQHIVTEWSKNSNYIFVRDMIIEPYTFTVTNKTRYTAEFSVLFKNYHFSDYTVSVEPGKIEVLEVTRYENEPWSFKAKSPASYTIKSQGFLSYAIELF